ncbi:MAG: hypothetical protein ABIP46_10465 [Polaromonas sp.]
MIYTDFSADEAMFLETLSVGGLATALDFLNTRTSYRFTSVYKAELPSVRRILVHDRSALNVPSREMVPVSQTFFDFMLTEPSFATADGLIDERSCQHPGRMHFRGFCGVRIHAPDGRHYGWLSHFDPQPQTVPEGEVQFLTKVSGLLIPALLAWPKAA